MFPGSDTIHHRLLVDLHWQHAGSEQMNQQTTDEVWSSATVLMPEGIASTMLPIRDLSMHILTAGNRSDPLLVLLHGFPELAYSWRNVILPLAHLGYHVVAPDQRGYGRTKHRIPPTQEVRPVTYEDDLRPYRMLNLVHDSVALVAALGHTSVACIIGHDFGSAVAGYCALIRPDLFRAVVLMSAPFTGPHSLPFAIGTDASPTAAPPPWLLSQHVDAALAKAVPPREHYTHYYSGLTANDDMLHAPQGLSAFLRSYFHLKSADWDGNDPHPLLGAEELAQLPHYYVMPRGATMADVAAAGAPSPKEVEEKSSRWLPEDELAFFVNEFGRTGFQGGLNRYRASIDESTAEELGLFAGKKIEVPAMFLSGSKDWGVYQSPGALDKMRREVCTQMAEGDVVLVDGAGHWVQQEQPMEMVKHVRRFLEKAA